MFNWIFSSSKKVELIRQKNEKRKTLRAGTMPESLLNTNKWAKCFIRNEIDHKKHFFVYFEKKYVITNRGDSDEQEGNARYMSFILNNCAENDIDAIIKEKDPDLSKIQKTNTVRKGLKGLIKKHWEVFEDTDFSIHPVWSIKTQDDEILCSVTKCYEAHGICAESIAKYIALSTNDGVEKDIDYLIKLKRKGKC